MQKGANREKDEDRKSFAATTLELMENDLLFLLQIDRK
jgi:hypothetical protein